MSQSFALSNTLLHRVIQVFHTVNLSIDKQFNNKHTFINVSRDRERIKELEKWFFKRINLFLWIWLRLKSYSFALWSYAENSSKPQTTSRWMGTHWANIGRTWTEDARRFVVCIFELSINWNMHLWEQFECRSNWGSYLVNVQWSFKYIPNRFLN